MGVLDKLKSEVITTFKVDVRPMKKGLKDLDKAQKKQAQSAIEAAEKQNDAMDSQIAMLGKVALGVGAVVAAYKAATVGLEAYEKRSRLTAATAGVNIKGLQKATKGLVSETRLLEFAAAATSGSFKLTQKEMEGALRGTIALRNEGNELGKTLDNVQKSLTEGTVEPLKELGHVIKGVENDTREGLDAALKDLTKTAREAGPDLRLPADEMTEAQTAMTDAVDDLKQSLGEIAVELAPVIALLAEMVSQLARAASFGFGSGNFMEAGRDALTAEARANEARRNSPAGLAGTSLQGGVPVGDSVNPFRMGGDQQAALREQFRKMQADAERIRNRRARNRGRGRRGPQGLSAEDDALLAAGVTATAEHEFRGNGLGSEIESGRAAMEQLRISSQGVADAGTTGLKEAIELAQAQQDSIFSQIFGTPAEIDAQTTAIIQLSGAFDSVAGAFGAGVDALITGSESFASAFKNAIGESLRSMAVEMSISALKHTAYGLASVAFLDGRGAAAHFAAAGQFGAGAIAAGAGARLLGAGQSASTGGARSGGVAPTAGASGVGSAAPASGGEGGSTRIIVLGDDYGSMNTREREARIREAMRGAGIQATGDFVVNG